MRGFRHFALRLAGQRGDAAILLAAMSVAPWHWVWWSPH